MLKLLLLSSLGAVLAGCSTTQQVAVDHTPQYCHTDQQIVLQDGSTVFSATKVNCTDNQITRVKQHQAGLANNCGRFTYHMNIGGKVVTKQGISCQRIDGTWEIINTGVPY
jgi:surface antigen